MSTPIRHIARSNRQAHCGASVIEHHPKTPGVPMALRGVCSKCLLAVNAERIKNQGWRVKV